MTPTAHRTEPFPPELPAPNRKHMPRYILPAAAGALLLILLILGLLPPDKHVLYPKCGFFCITGLKCPGCGAQTMMHHLLHGRFMEAWSSNALLLLSLPYIGMLVWLEYLGGKNKHPGLRKVMMGRVACIAAFIIILAWWITRNLAGW